MGEPIIPYGTLALPRYDGFIAVDYRGRTGQTHFHHPAYSRKENGRPQ